MNIKVGARAIGRNCLALSYLLLVSGVLLPQLLSPTGRAGGVDLEEGLPVLQWALAAVIAVAAGALVLHFWRRGVGGWLRAAVLPAAFAVFAVASSAWSSNPELTLRRGVALCGAVVLAVFFSGVVGYKRSMWLVTLFMAAAVIGSLLVAVMSPEFGVHQTGQHVGRWSGLYIHKNLLGRETALAAGMFVLAAMNSRSWFGRLAWTVVLVVSAVVLFKAGSATGAATALLVAATAVVMRFTRHRPLLRFSTAIAILTGLISLALVAVAVPNALTNLLGRDLTLTGRTDLWVLILNAIANKPVLGHGYGAFWASAEGAQVSADLGWRVTHAHNGWLAIGLDLGIVGLVLVLVLLVGLLYRASRLTRFAPEVLEYGSVVVAAALMVSISDAVLLGPNNVFVLLMLIHFVWANYLGRRRMVEPHA